MGLESPAPSRPRLAAHSPKRHHGLFVARRVAGEGGYTILVFAVLAFVLFPFLVVTSTSLKNIGEVFRSPATLIPETLVWSNFREIFTRIPLTRYLVNTLIIAGSATILNIGIGAPAAYALARVAFRGKALFALGILITQMFSPVIILIPLFKIMKGFGLLDSYVALIVTNTAVVVPFTTWMLLGFFRAVPEELEDAAMIDGLSRLQALFRIVLPLTMPGLITTSIYAFVTTWNEFIFALVLAPNRNMQPITMALYAWENNNTVEYNLLMATAVVATVPTIILFAFVRKRLTAGLMAGAVK
jgi:multiple sugar transport system permease protein